jgi:NADH-quinone oxidoreductase subunit N
VSTETVYLLLPEAILTLLATLIYLGGAFLPARRGWSWLAASSILLSGVALYEQGSTHPAYDAASAISVDLFSTTLRWATLGVGLVFVMLGARRSEDDESSEFMGSLLLILVGTMIVALANDLVLFFVGLELISIPTYLLLFLGRSESRLESGTKYFFLSILSSALLLYGFSFLYGAGGSTSLGTIRATLAAAGPEGAGTTAFAPLALILIFAGIGFRLTAVPFHFYAPDVYQGATNPNAGLLAVIPKIAALLVLVRIVFVAMPGYERLGWQLSLSVAMITMTLGNLLALWQNNVRRLLAYSSIAHAGYMLIGLAVGFAVAAGASEADPFDGIGATLFYLLVYAAATAGSFAALTYLSSERRTVDTLDELAGLSGDHPKTAAALAIFMFSLTGLPPLAGFWGKFTLFTGALGVDARSPESSNLWPWFLVLAIVGVLNAAISAGYYLRVVGLMYFRPAVRSAEGRGGTGAALAMAACVLLVIGIGCYPGPAVEQAKRASRAARTAWIQPTAKGDVKASPAALSVVP